MLNHGIVTAASFFVIAAIAVRVGGSENLDDMGGVAFKAPVLATFFLIITFANLAMPGSSNFIGEFMILLGTFDSHMAIAVIASLAVVGAAFYALRLFISSMHNRVGGRGPLAGDRRDRGDRDRPAGRDHPRARLLPAVRSQQVRGRLKVAIAPAAWRAGLRRTRCRAHSRPPRSSGQAPAD